MQVHDPNDDPFGDIAPPDTGLVSPMEFGSGAVEPTKEDTPAAATTAPVAASTNDEKKEDSSK